MVFSGISLNNFRKSAMMLECLSLDNLVFVSISLFYSITNYKTQLSTIVGI